VPSINLSPANSCIVELSSNEPMVSPVEAVSRQERDAMVLCGRRSHATALHICTCASLIYLISSCNTWQRAPHGLQMFVRPFRGRDPAMTIHGHAVTDYFQTLQGMRRRLDDTSTTV